jgi:cytosine permease
MTGGWLRRVGPWVGIGTSPAALMMGGGVAEGRAGARMLAAIGVGVVLLGALAAGQGLLGQREGLTLAGLYRRALGAGVLRRAASLAMLAMMVGWFALNVSVGGAGLGRLVGLPDRAGMALFAAAMLAVVWLGLDALSWTALAAGAATAALAVWGLAIVVGERDVNLLGDAASAPSSFVAGVALVVGYGAAFALRTPDFTHDLRRAADVVLCALVGLVIPVAAFATIGAALWISTGTWNLADVLRDLGSPTVAYGFLALGFAGSVMTNLHSGALALSDAAGRATFRPALVAVAVAGTGLAALRFSQWMIPYLTAMAVAAPALILLLWLDAARSARIVRGRARRPAGNLPGPTRPRRTE